MKYALVIGDGMADAPLSQLEGKTPLEALTLDAFDRAAGCEYGRVRTVPAGLAPGSDTAILSIFGNDPRAAYTGRSALEAAGMGISVPEGGVSFRLNLCAVRETGGERIMLSHNGGGVHGEEAEALMRALLEPGSPFAAAMQACRLSVYPTDTFRHIGVMEAPGVNLSALKLTEPHNILERKVLGYLPHTLARDPGADAMADALRELMEISFALLDRHPVNEARRQRGLLPANLLWPWGAATAMRLHNFTEKYGKTGSVVSAVPLVWGIAALGGLKTPRVQGANGDLDTNYQGKVDAALAALDGGDDFAAVHIEAPDEMAHAGDLGKKMQAIQNVNDRVLRPLLNGLAERGGEYRVLLMCDHPTLLTTRTHDAAPVPYAIYDSRKQAPPRKYSETQALHYPLIEDGFTLLERLFLDE